MPFARPCKGILRDPGPERERLGRGDSQGLPQACVALSSDRNRGDATAEERFKAISEAYAVLTDPDKRKLYDLSRATGAGTHAGRESEPWAYSSQEDILKDLLRNREASAIFEELTARVPAHGVSVRRRLRPSHVLWRSRRGLRWDLLRGPLWPQPGNGRGCPVPSAAARPPGAPGGDARASSGFLRADRRALSGIGKVARLALGSGGRGEDLTQDFSISRHEATRAPRSFCASPAVARRKRSS